MTNNSIHLTESDFKQPDFENCHLLIQLNPDGYAYAIVEKAQNRIIALGKNQQLSDSSENSLLQQFENFRRENETLVGSFQKVKISVKTHSFTFIPEELFEKNSLSEYSKFIASDPEDILIQSHIKIAKTFNILAINPDLIRALQSVFSAPFIVSQADAMIGAACNHAENENQSELFLNFSARSFEAVFICNQQFTFYNTFDIPTPDDFNYFLLNLISELNIDCSKPVTVSGEIDTNDDNYARLNKYFEQIFFADPIASFNDSESFKEVQSHLFFPVLSLDLCE